MSASDSPVPLDVGAARELLERVIEILETEDVSELHVGERRELVRHLGSLASSLSGLEAAQRDAERMDWLEANAHGVYRGIRRADGRPDVTALVRTSDQDSWAADTIREGIDMARRASDSGTEERL